MAHQYYALSHPIEHDCISNTQLKVIKNYIWLKRYELWSNICQTVLSSFHFSNKVMRLAFYTGYIGSTLVYIVPLVEIDHLSQIYEYEMIAKKKLNKKFYLYQNPFQNEFQLVSSESLIRALYKQSPFKKAFHLGHPVCLKNQAKLCVADKELMMLYSSCWTNSIMIWRLANVFLIRYVNSLVENSWEITRTLLLLQSHFVGPTTCVVLPSSALFLPICPTAKMLLWKEKTDTKKCFVLSF